jgi:hypothetical protein
MLSPKLSAEEIGPMSEANFDREEPGFAFTDEDYARRYFPGKSAAASRPTNPTASAAASQRPDGRLHGGGNSFMRARRRRLAATQTS